MKTKIACFLQADNPCHQSLVLVRAAGAVEQNLSRLTQPGPQQQVLLDITGLRSGNSRGRRLPGGSRHDHGPRLLGLLSPPGYAGDTYPDYRSSDLT